MGRKSCFTCGLRTSRDVIEEEKKAMKEQNIKDGKRFRRIPEIIINCNVTGDRIGIADDACEHHNDDELMVEIRSAISDVAKKLRKELEDNR